jgi:ABC-2 type transport system permease protein
MSTYIFRSTLQEFLRVRRIMVWLLVALLVFAAGKAFTLVARDMMNQQESYATLSALLTFLLLPLISAIFSSSVVSQEVEQKTIVYLLTRPVRRETLILMRSLASIVVVALLGGVCALAVSASVFGSGAFGNGILYRDLLAIAMGALAYGFLFVLISLLANRAMIISLLFAFAWETSLSHLPGNMHLLSISTYLTAIAQRPSTSSGGGGVRTLGALASNLGTNSLSPDTGWAVLIILIGVCAALSMWWFKQFEYLPREDAE